MCSFVLMFFVSFYSLGIFEHLIDNHLSHNDYPRGNDDDDDDHNTV